MGICQSRGSGHPVALGSSPSILPRKEFDNVREHYTFEKELGRGAISIMRRVRNKQTEKVFACKSISKIKVSSQEELHDVKQEIKIFKHVSTNHPHIAQFIQAYEDMTDVHMVVEECTGGDLFDRILRDRIFSEATAASILSSVLSVVQHCHSMNVIHRGINPESFLFVSDSPDAVLKLVDFSCSTFVEASLEDVIGNPHYLAPEMLRGSYSREVDVWSAGVLLYVLLSGYPPFQGNTNAEVFEQIVSCPLNLKSEPWPKVSPSAKDLVRKMLMRDPKRRLTADQVLQHPWFNENTNRSSVKPAAPTVLLRMKEFAQYNKLKKEALKVIVGGMPEAEIEGMRNIFQSIDRDHSGQITAEELRRGLKAQGAAMGLTQVLEGVDTDGNHVVDYLEFLAATMRDLARMLSEREKHDRMFQAFRHFDVDESGFISMDELKAALGGAEANEESILRIMAEVDKNKDGKIDYQEFTAMLGASDNANLRESGRKLRIDANLSRKLRETPLSDKVDNADINSSDGRSSLGSRSSQLSSGTISVGQLSLTGDEVDRLSMSNATVNLLDTVQEELSVRS